MCKHPSNYMRYLTYQELSNIFSDLGNNFVPRLRVEVVFFVVEDLDYFELFVSLELQPFSQPSLPNIPVCSPCN